ncbi:putative transcriptional regulatory protein LacI family [Vibrio nigripulchritudo SOn1]|uniref:Transcriptional regulatory protein LacI family n=1 Tax=Vibrio nigripulchritudo SOn1 TaxID=1238450 RepID=A0AAV2VT58_9VIBR|nr:LacI family DNA-binding transcriptional regulator [Vibrio nigripulchritudo]CCO47881.1 putative transcriptional regulatory protein LacI family [Vibrio nigripulchritudo SOn1]
MSTSRSTNKKKRITVKDVAKALNINASTVSRALSPDKQHLVSDRVVEQVIKKSREMGYSVNPLASALKKGATKTIGVMIPDILNPMFPPLINQIQQRAHKLGYTLTFAYTENNSLIAMEELKRLVSRNVDGVIMASAFREDPTVEYCQQMHIPLVLLARSVDSHDIDQILVDDSEGIHQLTLHLYNLGHRKIAHIAGPTEISSGFNRKLAFKAATEMHGLQPTLVQASAFSEDAGRAASKELFEKYPDTTAVIASNDLLALGCIGERESQGVRCPEDISITGINDMPFLEWFRTPLTTLSIPNIEMANEAINMLVNQINVGTEKASSRKVLLQPKLVIRQSTKKLNN